MARLNKRDRVARQDVLYCESSSYPICAQATYLAYHTDRRLIFLTGSVHSTLTVRRRRNQACPAYTTPLRPGAEGALALTPLEFECQAQVA